MKKVISDEVRSGYKRTDLGRGIRGNYLKSYQAGTNLVLLSPDVVKVFHDEEAVNQALRSLIKVALTTVGSTKRTSRRGKKRRVI